MSEGLASLTDKERQTLRLIARGHDAKSTALHLGLSVHTINERLRIARRKLSVTSSREAARLLLDREEATHCFLADKDLGEAEPASDMGWIEPAKDGRKTRRRFASILAGGAVISLILAVLTIIANSADAPRSAVADAGAAATSVDPAVAQAARSWLELVDLGRWSESWEAAGSAFKRLNTVEQWLSASEQARVPLGAALSRTVLAQENLPAPPSGYEVLRFRTSFVGKADAIETVTLEREGSAWRVVGYVID